MPYKKILNKIICYLLLFFWGTGFLSGYVSYFMKKICVTFASFFTSNHLVNLDNIASASKWPIGGFKSSTESSPSSSTSSSTAMTLKVIWSSFKILNRPSCLSLSNQSVTSFVYCIFWITQTIFIGFKAATLGTATILSRSHH